MRKNLVLLLLVILSVASVGCKKTNKDEKVTVLDNGIVVVDTGKDIKEENASDVYDNGGTGIIATSVYRFPQDRSERSVPLQHRRQVCHRRIRAQYR